MSKVIFRELEDEVLKSILVARGITSDLDLDHCLASMPAPEKLSGMETAVGLLAEALREKQSILILGDYDADGATASALAVRAIKAMGGNQVSYLVPNRFEYGYGLSPEIAEVALSLAPDLVITVDNGISSVEGVRLLKAAGIRVIVTDHHLPGDELPDADAILNPNQPNCDFPSKNLAGVGVLFYLMVGLRSALRAQNWFVENKIEEPRLEQFLDLVALGTVADLVPLDRVNRMLVIAGLRLLASGRGNPGIAALFEVSGRDIRRAKSTDLGFAIGPRINAAGRLDDISEGIRCLLEDDYAKARELALDLHHTNLERRQIQAQMVEDAEAIIESLLEAQDGELPWALCCYRPDWHQGVVGLVASRLKESLNRPAIAFARADQDGRSDEGLVELKGSARSIEGLHIRDLLDAIATQRPDLIQKFGGHAMAAGLSIAEKDYPAFAKIFEQEVRLQLSEEDLEQVLWSDGELDSGHLNLEFARKIESLLPWGQRLPEPTFHGEFRIEQYRWLKEKHLKLSLRTVEVDSDGDPSEGHVIEAIWFNAKPESAVEEGAPIKLVYRLGVNDYRGRESLQLMVVDEFA